MFVEVISLQYDSWHHNLSPSRHKLGLVAGVPQVMYSGDHVLLDYIFPAFDSKWVDLSRMMERGGGEAAYRCAQLFCLESYLTDLYSTMHGDYDHLPKIVTGFWRMYEYKYGAKIPTCFQEIPKIGLTIVLDFGEPSKSEPAIRRLIEKYESEGEICLVSASQDNWKDKIRAEIETRFGSAFSDYHAKNKAKVDWLISGHTFCYNEINDEVPF